MSWQIQSERRAERDFPLEIEQLMDDLRRNAVSAQETGGEQVIGAIAAARLILQNVRTQYPLGCLVRVVCDGHAPGDALNYDPLHVNVRVMVEPVKITR